MEKIIKNLYLKFIRIYRVILSPLTHSIFGVHFSGCRFSPSCSEYSYEAVIKFGIFKGLARSFLRVSRCNPFSRGGFDPLV